MLNVDFRETMTDTDAKISKEKKNEEKIEKKRNMQNFLNDASCLYMQINDQ